VTWRLPLDVIQGLEREYHRRRMAGERVSRQEIAAEVLRAGLRTVAASSSRSRR
jgi:hypothetical protein